MRAAPFFITTLVFAQAAQPPVVACQSGSGDLYRPANSRDTQLHVEFMPGRKLRGIALRRLP